jgi:hydrogenase maturation factor HypE
MEIYCQEDIAGKIIKIARKYKVESKIIGHCEASEKGSKNQLLVESQFGTFEYE